MGEALGCYYFREIVAVVCDDLCVVDGCFFGEFELEFAWSRCGSFFGIDELHYVEESIPVA